MERLGSHPPGDAPAGHLYVLPLRYLCAPSAAIRALAALGLATEIHLLPKNAERFRIPSEAPAEPEPAPAVA